MDTTFIRALVALGPTCLLFLGSIVVFVRGKTLAAQLQLLGSACLIVVVFTHIAEARQWVSWMRWGEEESPGHYLDLASALLGVTLFPVG